MGWYFREANRPKPHEHDHPIDDDGLCSIGDSWKCVCGDILILNEILSGGQLVFRRATKKDELRGYRP